MARSARQWRRVADQRLQGFGLTEATWLPLIHLSRAEAPMRQKDLAASLVLDGSTVVRLLDGLQDAGLIDRREDPADRRAKVIVLTPAGEALVAPLQQVTHDIRREVMGDLDEAELQIATRVMRRISQRLTALMEAEA